MHLLLDSDAGKRRLLAIEIPALDAYNDGRDDAFRVRVERLGRGLALRYRLKPTHNVYELETRLLGSYPAVPPETRVVSHDLGDDCPHLLEGRTLCLWRQGSTRAESRWNPAAHTCVVAVHAAWRWLACYELWRDTGVWPLPEAK